MDPRHMITIEQDKAPTTADYTSVDRVWTTIKPYAELMRMEKPAGTAVLFFPCIFGSLLVGCLAQSYVSPLDILHINLVLLVGSFLVRSLGCTWNDIIDREVDKHVKRTASRPLPRGAIRVEQASVFCMAQLLFGISLCITTLNWTCFAVGIPSMAFVALYPFAKRFTYYPQLVLAVPACWGIILVYPALLQQDQLLEVLTPAAALATAALVVACGAWTVLYDTIYSAQDVKDDLKIGVKSIMTKHQSRARKLLRALALLQSSCLGLCAYYMNASAAFWLVGWGLTSMLVERMTRTVDLEDPANCGWWFKTGNMYVGLAMAGGFLLEYSVSLLN